RCSSAGRDAGGPYINGFLLLKLRLFLNEVKPPPGSGGGWGWVRAKELGMISSTERVAYKTSSQNGQLFLRAPYGYFENENEKD
ncbi:MAG: hypothetical protein ACYC7E_22465, partial [Armatimonadota bacterium]